MKNKKGQVEKESYAVSSSTGFAAAAAVTSLLAARFATTPSFVEGM
jgi:Mrp family chromosome partitioning ATPase